MAVSVPNNLDLLRAATDVVALHSLEDPLVEEAVRVRRIALCLLASDPEVEDAVVSACVRFTVCFGSKWNKRYESERMTWRKDETNKGIWKNIIALGFASLLVWGGSWSSLWRSQMWPKSLPLSGVNGRWMGWMEAGRKSQSRDPEPQNTRTGFLKEPVNLALQNT